MAPRTRVYCLHAVHPLRGDALAEVAKPPDARLQIRSAPRGAAVTGAAWQFYDPVALFEAIVRKPPDHPGAVVERFGLSDLRRRVYFYNVLLDALVALTLILFLWWGHTQPAKAELQAAKGAQGVFKFDDVLFAQKNYARWPALEKPKAMILVAVSGGGTRAALYGAAVFRGLFEFRALKDVQLRRRRSSIPGS